jgi:membrane-associated protein
MLPSPSEVLAILEHYKYLVIFPIAVVEGPIIIVISGFLVYLGVLNGVVAYILLVIADVLGDVLYYSIGRFWRGSRWVRKLLGFLGYSEKSEEFLENHFEKHIGKTILISKFSHGIGGAVQVASGIAQVDIREYLLYSFLGTIPKTVLLLFLGYFLGSSYIKINGYLNDIALFTTGFIVCIILVYYFLSKYIKKMFEKGK